MKQDYIWFTFLADFQEAVRSD
jgi:hypothetical protein